jgi:uncharacterized protein YjeT (DUF2065 family)
MPTRMGFPGLLPCECPREWVSQGLLPCECPREWVSPGLLPCEYPREWVDQDSYDAALLARNSLMRF